MPSRHRPLRSEYTPMRTLTGRRFLHAPATTLSPASMSIPSDDSAPPVVVCIVGGRAYPPAETNTPRRARAPPVVFTPRPSLRVFLRDIPSIVQRLPSRLMRATPAFTIIASSSVFASRAVLVAARVWPPRWRARPRTRAVRDVRSDAVVAEVVFSFAYLRIPQRRPMLRAARA